MNTKLVLNKLKKSTIKALILGLFTKQPCNLTINTKYILISKE